MICKFHIVQFSIEIYTIIYLILSSHLHCEFHFKHRKNVEQKKSKFLELNKMIHL